MLFLDLFLNLSKTFLEHIYGPEHRILLQNKSIPRYYIRNFLPLCKVLSLVGNFRNRASGSVKGKLMRVFPVLYMEVEKKTPKNRKFSIWCFHGVILWKRENVVLVSGLLTSYLSEGQQQIVYGFV